MRKFTKEISALLASVAFGAAAYAGVVSASSEQTEKSEGVMTVSDESVETTTEEYFPPEDGIMMTEALTEPTTEEELPPTAGDPMPPDEWIETTTEEEIPPLAGDIATADGDINGDGSFGVSDVVLLQKWMLSVPDTHLANWWAADFNYDNRLDVFDLCLMKRALIEKMNENLQNVDTSFKLQSVADIRTNGDSHKKWMGFIARSEDDLKDIIQKNESVSADEISIEGIDNNVFNDKSIVIVYSICKSGNSYSIIDNMSIKDTGIDASTVSKKPMIATPDMLYRRYIYLIDKNAVTNVSEFTFNDSSSYYQYDEESDVVKWFDDWRKS